MMQKLALSFFVLVCASSAAAQSLEKIPGTYDPNGELTYTGVVTSVISVVGPDGTVGVHLDLKTVPGVIVRVQLGPAMFIGMNNFSFIVENQITVRGAYVVHDGEVGLWAREVVKNGKTLTLRGPDGTPRWPRATAEDPDGCGVAHGPVRY